MSWSLRTTRACRTRAFGLRRLSTGRNFVNASSLFEMEWWRGLSRGSSLDWGERHALTKQASTSPFVVVLRCVGFVNFARGVTGSNSFRSSCRQTFHWQPGSTFLLHCCTQEHHPHVRWVTLSGSTTSTPQSATTPRQRQVCGHHNCAHPDDQTVVVHAVLRLNTSSLLSMCSRGTLTLMRPWKSWGGRGGGGAVDSASDRLRLRPRRCRSE